jgi:hypothetical protein
MGIVNDPHWVLHEFGHVLLMATTGELELRFSHSIGDALAAIATDPASHFVGSTGDDDEEKERKRRWRGVTYPWVYLPRRHDRGVERGWSWSGAIHRPLREIPDSKLVRRKGYRSEQILSTSLFRLYLCLGGITPDNEGRKRRQDASDYTLYLIIKALGLLGDARVVGANHPDQLVSALIDADIGTQRFRMRRLGIDVPGGFAHKAIRWAFEAQGLYAADALVENNDKGEPPLVDIFISDRRPARESWCGGGVGHGPGAYVPVPFTVPVCPDGPGTPPVVPQWMAHAESVIVSKKMIQVWVANRGAERADGVTVRVFCAIWDGAGLPDWNPQDATLWQTIDQRNSHAADMSVASSGREHFAIAWQPSAGKTYLILTEASCEAERANTDPESHLACGHGPTALADLVASDNNLGLTVWTCE